MIITGPQIDLDIFYNENKTEDSELELEQSIPRKEPSHEESIKEWSTTQTLSYLEVSQAPNKLNYSFQSRFGPPENWLRSIAKLYPTLFFNLDYEDECEFFKGKIYAHGSVFTDDEQH